MVHEQFAQWLWKLFSDKDCGLTKQYTFCLSEDLDIEIWVPLDWVGTLRNRCLSCLTNGKGKNACSENTRRLKGRFGQQNKVTVIEKMVSNGLLETVS